MKESAITVSGKNSCEAIRGGIFFVLFYLYLWLIVKPELIYHGGGEITNFPVFYKWFSFFNELVWHPGGLIEYSSAFLSQLLYYSWTGAIVLAVHALLTCVFTGLFLKQFGIKRWRFLSFIPSVILLITYNMYTYHFTAALTFLAALIFSCIYVKVAPKNKMLSVLLFFLLCIVSYLIAADGYLFFTLLCVIYEIFYRRRWFTGLFYGIFGVCIGYIAGVLVCNISLTDAYSRFLPFSQVNACNPDRGRMIEAVYLLYLFLPAIAVVFGLFKLFTQSSLFLLYIKGAGKSKSLEEKKKKVRIKSGKSTHAVIKTVFNFLKTVMSFGFIFIVAGGAVFYFADYERKAAFEVDYYINRGNWQKVLEIGCRYQNNDHISHALNRALFHLGKMPSDMFCYKQRPGCLMLTTTKEMDFPWHRVGVFFDLGTMNHCETNLATSLEVYGERPEILKKLAIIGIAKNEIGTAEVYLGALCKTLFYSDWAEDYLQRLKADPDMTTDKQIQRLRNFMPEKDKGALDFSSEEIFIELLEKNPENQMAFEYLMAFYMFLGDLEKFIQNIHRLDDFGYKQIPRHYEEAILTYIYLNNKMPDLNDRSISDKSQRRFSDYLQLSNRYRGNQKAAFGPLSEDFGDTYFFYYVYNTTGP